MDDKLFGQLATDPVAFRAQLLIDADGGPVRLGEVLDPWQRSDFERLDPALRRVVGQDEGTAVYLRAYLERPRGHSKTGDLAVVATWLLAFSHRRLSGVAAAADRDQARLLRDAIGQLVRLNQWLLGALEIQNYRVLNGRTGSTLEILSCDAPSSFGLTPDFLVLDELSHWSTPELWDSLISAAAKRANCLAVVISNAGVGMGSSWQWHVREACRTDPAWYFSRIDGPRAHWITADRLAEQRRLLPAPSYRRLWLNQWLTEAGDALNPEDLDASLAGDLQPILGAQPGYVYAAGLDLGLTRDNAALVLVGKQQLSGRIRLARVWSWNPRTTGKVDQAAIEATIKEAYATFRFTAALADWFQGEYLLQRLSQARIPFERFAFTPANSDRLARNLINQFQERNLQLYEQPALVKELRTTSIVESGQGKLRLLHPRTEDGHGDHMIAFALAILAVQDAQPPVTFRRPQGFPPDLHCPPPSDDHRHIPGRPRAAVGRPPTPPTRFFSLLDMNDLRRSAADASRTLFPPSDLDDLRDL